MRRILIIPALLLSLLVAGCSGSTAKTAATGAAGAVTSAGGAVTSAGGAVGSSVQAGASSVAGSTGAATATGCPTSNTRSFAKTRFVADVGGALVLLNRYVLKPYKAGSFRKGAHGRTIALIKAGTAVAATAKLVKNAQVNAQANPTLCRAVSGPLGKLSSSLTGVVGGLTAGSLPGGIGGLGGLVNSVKSGATQAGIPIK